MFGIFQDGDGQVLQKHCVATVSSQDVGRKYALCSSQERPQDREIGWEIPGASHHFYIKINIKENRFHHDFPLYCTPVATTFQNFYQSTNSQNYLWASFVHFLSLLTSAPGWPLHSGPSTKRGNIVCYLIIQTPQSWVNKSCCVANNYWERARYATKWQTRNSTRNRKEVG